MPGRHRSLTPQSVRRAAILEVEREVWHQVMNRDQFACVLCGTRQRATVQHIRPRGAGGTSVPIDARLGVVLCGSGTTGCHGAVENDGRFDGWSYDLGYLFRHGVELDAVRNDDDATHVLWAHADRAWIELTRGGVRTILASRPAPAPEVLALVDAAIGR